MKNKILTYGILCLSLLYFYIGGYFLLFPKKTKDKIGSLKDSTIRMWGFYILIGAFLLFLLLLICGRLLALLTISSES